MKKPLRERSALAFVLIALIPYSRPNLLLSFKPSLFFRELEKISRYKEATLKAAYRRAQKQELVKQRENIIALTARGRRKVAPFITEDLEEGKLMVIFDIPEDKRSKRRQLRQTLKEWQFVPVQKSVWLTGKDYENELVELIKELRINQYVKLYECIRKFPN